MRNLGAFRSMERETWRAFSLSLLLAIERMQKMTMELLRELAAQRLPLTVTDAVVVHQIRLLRAANFIAALTSAPNSDQAFGTVLAIIKRGREALKIDQQDKAPRSFERSGSAFSAPRRLS